MAARGLAGDPNANGCRAYRLNRYRLPSVSTYRVASDVADNVVAVLLQILRTVYPRSLQVAKKLSNQDDVGRL